MRIRPFILISASLSVIVWMACFFAPVSNAQFGKKGATETAEQFIKQMMNFDKSKDGKLTKKELTEPRLHKLFDRADTKKNGYLTKADLQALYEREALQGGGFGGKKGKGGFGKKGKGFGPKKGKGPPGPGQILPPFVLDELKLSGKQRKQLDALQKEVDERLYEILTPDQRKQLQEIRERGPFPPPPGAEGFPPR